LSAIGFLLGVATLFVVAVHHGTLDIGQHLGQQRSISVTGLRHGHHRAEVERERAAETGDP
jgi:hypothetical protein